MVNYLLMFSHCVVSNSFGTTWTTACQASLSMEFPRQEDWSCHFLCQEIFPTQGLNPHLFDRRILYRLTTWEDIVH